MKKNPFVLNTLLAALFGLALLVGVLVRTFLPGTILFPLDLPMLVLFSLAALLPEHYLAKEAGHNYLINGLLAALTFGLLPMAACIHPPVEAACLGVLGGLVFAAVNWLFDTMVDRISTGPAALAAPWVSALGLYLAAQCFMGMI